jgi:hypothetical protein
MWRCRSTRTLFAHHAPLLEKTPQALLLAGCKVFNPEAQKCKNSLQGKVGSGFEDCSRIFSAKTA